MKIATAVGQYVFGQTVLTYDQSVNQLAFVNLSILGTGHGTGHLVKKVHCYKKVLVAKYH